MHTFKKQVLQNIDNIIYTFCPSVSTEFNKRLHRTPSGTLLQNTVGGGCPAARHCKDTVLPLRTA